MELARQHLSAFLLKARRCVGQADRDAVGLFWHYFRNRRGRLLFYALAASLQSLFVLPTLYLIRKVFDEAIPEGDMALLPWLGGGIILIRLLQGVVGLWLRGFVLEMIKAAVRALRYDLLDRLFVLSREHFNHADVDRMHTRIVLDSERFENLSNRLLSSMLPALFSSFVLLTILLILNGRLVLMTAALVPLLAWSSRWGSRRVKAQVHNFQLAMERFSKGARFALRQMDLIRLQTCEDQEKAAQHEHIRHLSATSRRMAMSFAVHGFIQRNLSGLAGVIILVAGGAAVAHGDMSLGDLMSFYVAAGLLNGQVDSLSGGVPEVVAGRESVLKLHGLLNTGEEQAYKGRRCIEFDGSISLRGVGFAYGEKDILHSADLEIRPGEQVAIVGANGSGKTTLINLIVGFCRPRTGQIHACGVAYDELDIRALRKDMGVVMQQQSFFAGTVLENLRYGHPEADPDAVRAAARLALADDFIQNLPQGYDSEIGEGGSLLSGGERQKLSITRALLGTPKLLILDEPTNHLDADTISRLMQSLASAPSRPAILFISHDPDVTASANRVYRLQENRLVMLEQS